jgi:hypothetical protein
MGQGEEGIWAERRREGQELVDELVACCGQPVAGHRLTKREMGRAAREGRLVKIHLASNFGESEAWFAFTDTWGITSDARIHPSHVVFPKPIPERLRRASPADWEEIEEVFAAFGIDSRGWGESREIGQELADELVAWCGQPVAGHRLTEEEMTRAAREGRLVRINTVSTSGQSKVGFGFTDRWVATEDGRIPPTYVVFPKPIPTWVRPRTSPACWEYVGQVFAAFGIQPDGGARWRLSGGAPGVPRSVRDRGPSGPSQLQT